MAKSTRFRKLALRPGKYEVTTSQGRVAVDLTPKRLREAVAQTNKLLKETAALIPVPLAHHDDQGRQPGPVLLAENGGSAIDAATGLPIGWRSDLNAGFVKSVSYGVDENGDEGVLVDLDISGDPNDAQSYAAKFGDTIRETSLVLQPSYRDSKGRTYGEVITQVAAVTRPVELGQSNFALAMSEGIVMAHPMPPAAKPKAKKPAAPAKKPSPLPPAEDEVVEDPSAVAEEETPIDDADPNAPAENPEGGDFPLEDPQNVEAEPADAALTDAIAALNEFGLALPDDTTRDNFIDRLRLCLRQHLADKKGPQNPDDSQQQMGGASPAQPSIPQQPIAMSQTNAVPAQNAALTILLSQTVVTRKNDLMKRANSLIARGRVSGDWVKTNIVPRIEAIQMSEASLTPEAMDHYAKTGRFPALPVEEVLDALESTAGPDLTVTMSEGAGLASPPAGSIPDRPEMDSSHSAWKAVDANPNIESSVSEDEAFELAASIG